MHYFTSQETTRSLRASQYRPRKSASLHPDEDEQADEDEPLSTSDVKQRAQSSSFAAHASPEVAQLRLAGLLPGEEHDVPSAPFPHASARSPKDRSASTNVQHDLASLPVPLYAVPAVPGSGLSDGKSAANALRKTHLDVLSTIMHRCLLEGDYGRAGRAWGMILRTQVAGAHPVDPRNHGRWGIGAEVLLRRRSPNIPGRNQQSPADVADTDHGLFSPEGFELAREYYERLIVEHPNRKTQPNAIDERSFYPAMFSLWIFETSERSKQARMKIQNEDKDASRGISVDSVLGDEANNARSKRRSLQVEELAQAMEIAARLDQLIVSPPFDKNGSLLLLRGNISLWMSDLMMGRQALDEDWDMDSVLGHSEDEAESKEEQLKQLTKCHREVQQAQTFVKRAETNGMRGQTSTIATIDIKLRELARSFDKLHASQHDDTDSSLTSDHSMS